ncbi:hypothetical protein L7F22_011429 [Adiantum nelumboides]|nr:hypothetical protein [Adiantum nelumboides]
MACNREQALFRRRSKQNFSNMTLHNKCQMQALHGKAQNSSLSDVVDLPYYGPATMRNQQDIRVVQHQYGLNASLSGTLKSCSNFEGLEVVVREATVNTEKNEMLASTSSMTAQEFDYVVVIDFEATCDKNMEKLKPQEIIEFPSVLVDCHRLTLGDYFQTYVRPERHPTLTDFCSHLTGIQQEQVRLYLIALIN